ncbi:hypothetical protein EMCRGX_G022839 [Ephydatia muelleri]
MLRVPGVKFLVTLELRPSAMDLFDVTTIQFRQVWERSHTSLEYTVCLTYGHYSMDIWMAKGLKCLLNLLLSAAIYVIVVFCFLTVYSSSNVVILTPYKRADQPYHCTPRACDGDAVTDVQTLAILDVQPHHTMVNELAGCLNYDVWRQMPGYLVDDMRVRRSFPNHPDIRQITDTLRIDFSEEAGDSHHNGKYAHKIYGFLRPFATGAHTFGFDISKRSALFDLELWLSNSTNPLHTRKILKADTAHQVAPPPSGPKRRRKWRKDKEPTTPPNQPPSQARTLHQAMLPGVLQMNSTILNA